MRFYLQDVAPGCLFRIRRHFCFSVERSKNTDGRFHTQDKEQLLKRLDKTRRTNVDIRTRRTSPIQGNDGLIYTNCPVCEFMGRQRQIEMPVALSPLMLFYVSFLERRGSEYAVCSSAGHSKHARQTPSIACRRRELPEGRFRSLQCEILAGQVVCQSRVDWVSLHTGRQCIFVLRGRPGQGKRRKRQRTPLVPPTRIYRARRFRLSLAMASRRPMFWQGSVPPSPRLAAQRVLSSLQATDAHQA